MPNLGGWAVEYASFIFLGLTVCVGYLIWRLSPGRKAHHAQRGEAWLAEELRAARAQRTGLDAPSGLEGPAPHAQQAALLRAARSTAQTSTPPPDQPPASAPVARPSDPASGA